jgi:diguanylate cyclase (GGDEF)-like protein
LEPDPTGTRTRDPLLEAALGSMPYGFSIWNEERRLVLYNRQYLDMYGFPEDRVWIGMGLRDMAALTRDVDNHPGFSIEELAATYARRLRAAGDPGKVVHSRQPVRDRVVKTNHVRVPGLGWIVTHEDVTVEIARLEALHANQDKLASQNMRFEAAVENMSQGLCMFDGGERLVICNAAYAEMYRLPPELVRPGTQHAEIVAFRDTHGMQPVKGAKSFSRRHWELRGGETSRRVRVELADGRIISVHHRPTPDGGWVATHQDVTDELRRVARLEARERDLALQNMRFEAAVENISQGLCMFDSERRLVICNSAYARLYNLPPELMAPGTSLERILDYRFEHGMVPVGGRNAYVEGRAELVRKRMFARDVIEMEDGRAIAVNHHPMGDGGWVATHEDITEQRRSEARIRHLARHDALTDLPNRIYFREEMEKAEGQLRRGLSVAVLCIDLDYFKAVNDTQGHAVGDAVLRLAARRLEDAAGGSHLVARLGGDEFAILATGLAGPDEAAAIAGRVVESLAAPMPIEGLSIQIGASVGVAVAPTDGNTAETLLNNADLALYRAKSEGRGTWHFFEVGMDRALQVRRTLEQGLRMALGRGELRLVYQPLVSLDENRICCLEALLRWDHPERGTVSPVEFIPIAEETGLIVPIGEWALREACRAATAWPEDIHVAVNLSAVQFRNRGLVGQVTAALAAAGLAPQRLELEITESLQLADTTATLDTLHRLRALGVRISMDDFGTGYSSLSYLRSFPFDKIKIDRSFITGLTPSLDSVAIIRAVIGLGQSLGMTTTAEGIETEDQLAAVRAQGCSEVQGFLFSPPLPASGVGDLLRAWETRAVAAREPLRRKA